MLGFANSAVASQFKVCEIGATRYLLLQSPWESGIAEVMKRYGIKHLRLNRPTERQVQIDFLRELPFLERVELSAMSVVDVTPLYDLPSLRRLRIDGFKKEIDFTRIPELEELRLDWHPKFFSSLLACERLRTLGIGCYKAGDLEPFDKLASLEELIISQAPLESLAGIENFPKLARLSLDFIDHLNTLVPLNVCRSLLSLTIDGAKNLRDISPLSGLRNLSDLGLQRCPHIKSLQPIRGLPRLQTIGLLETTSIEDGDLSVLETLPALKHASFVDRRHYTRKNADFPKVYRPANKLVVLYNNSASADVSGRIH
jgi:hypothetical protein